MRIKAIMIGLAAASTLVVTACGPDAATPSSPGGSTGTSGSTQGGGGTASGRDGCLSGTWKVDVDDMARQAASKLPQAGTTGKGTGAITLVFGDSMTITYDNAVISIKAPISDGLVMVMDATYSGAATSTDWQAKDGKLAGTMPVNTIKGDIKVTMGGQTVPMTSIPFDGALNLNEGNLSYTCSGSTATLVGPGVTWKMTKA